MIPQAVVFDMDGLLLDSERLYLNAYRETRSALGLDPDDALFLSMVGTNSTLGRTTLESGLGDAVSLERFETHWADTCARHVANGIPIKAGVDDLLAALAAQDTPFTIATSTKTDKAWAHLEKAGLDHHFKTLIGGDQVSRSKPAPDIYIAATNALGLEPATCVAFEDSENGVRAAHAAGLITVQIPDLIQPSQSLRALGHTVANDLIAGATAVKLLG